MDLLGATLAIATTERSQGTRYNVDIFEECQPRARSHPSFNQPRRFFHADVEHSEDEIRAIREVGIYSRRCRSVGGVPGRHGIRIAARSTRVRAIEPH